MEIMKKYKIQLNISKTMPAIPKTWIWGINTSITTEAFCRSVSECLKCTRNRPTKYSNTSLCYL